MVGDETDERSEDEREEENGEILRVEETRRGDRVDVDVDVFSGLLLFEQSGADEKVCQDAPVGELLQLFRRVGVRHVRRLFEVL